MSMRSVNRREYVRKAHHFQSSLFKLGLYSPAAGMTENLSPGGALIKTSDWRAFQARDQVVVTLFIPPSFSGQERTISLQGAATVIRVDQKREGIAVQFEKTLKQFERVDEV